MYALQQKRMYDLAKVDSLCVYILLTKKPPFINSKLECILSPLGLIFIHYAGCQGKRGLDFLDLTYNYEAAIFANVVSSQTVWMHIENVGAPQYSLADIYWNSSLSRLAHLCNTTFIENSL